MLTSINPYTNKVIAQYEEDTRAQLDAKISAAASEFKNWKNKSFQERKILFLKLAEVFSQKNELLASLITEEMGKPYVEALGEIKKCIAGIQYYAENVESLLKETHIKTDASESYVSYEPLGTVLAMMPWNFPIWQSIRCSVPAMMAGNTILLKLAPNTTSCAKAIEECFAEAGFPSGSFQILYIQNETSSYIIQQKEIKAISLTGSERAGVIVAAEAGRNLKKIVLELGGSDPFIVLEDADIEHTADMAIKGRLLNAGQSCIAAKRFIIHKNVYKAFTEKLIERLKNITLGDPMEATTRIGPLARKDLKMGLLKQVKKTIEKGATILYGTLNETEDNFFNPILLENIKPDMPAYSEEFFGPVFSLMTFTTEVEAIQLANDTPYGLGASIWTKDIKKAKEIAKEIESGMVFINDFVKSDIRLPFGGTKISGYGRELGEIGVKEFVNAKTVYIRD